MFDAGSDIRSRCGTLLSAFDRHEVYMYQLVRSDLVLK